MPGLKVFDGSSWRATGVEDSQWDILSATAGGSVVDLSWPSAGGSPSYYEINVDDSIINAGNVTSYTVTGLTIGQTYNFKVRPVYADGSTGGWSYFKNRGPNGFNNASGGSVTTINNYNGTGETWKIHTFTSSGDFVVTDNPGFYDFRVLVVGGGGGGGGGTNGGGGGAGGVVDSTNALGSGSIPITVGSGQSPNQGRVISSSGTSSIGSYVSAGGGMGGGNNYGARGGNSGSPQSNAGGYAVTSNKVGGGAGSNATNGSPGTTNYGGNGVTSDIHPGVTDSVCFAGGGGGGSRGTGHGVGACGGGSGPGNGNPGSRRGSGGAGADFDGSGGAGYRGEVIIAYRIA